MTYYCRTVGLVLTGLLLTGISTHPQQRSKTAPRRAPATTAKKVPPKTGSAEAAEKPETPPPPRKLLPSEPLGTIVLVPIDDRPVAAQFAQLIGQIGDQRVILPPKEMLGRFTTPGNPARLRKWLGEMTLAERRKLAVGGGAEEAGIGGIDYSNVNALVVSIDMMAFGGLIASRASETRLTDALERLEFLRWFKQSHPGIPVYAFSTIMRIAPTASRQTRAWRDDLARWAELMDRAPRTNDAKLAAELEVLKQKLDKKVIDDYLSARRRNLQVNLAAIRLYEEKVIDNLILLQDDAREFGLHRHDQVILKEKLKSLGFEDDIPIYNGADEGALALVSRAALEHAKRQVSVAVVYSSEAGRKAISPYEDHPLEFTVENQIRASGSRIVGLNDPRDYTLYVNAPQTSAAEFEGFCRSLVSDLKAGRNTALADLLFPAPHHSGADERLVSLLKSEGLIDKLVSFAAWNTAGNSLGTAIPAANMRILAQQLNDHPLRAERTTVAWLEFLLNRFAGDYIYHDIVRLEIDDELRKPPAVPTDELTEDLYNRTSQKVRERMSPQIEKFFREQFAGHSYKLGMFEGVPKEMKVTALTDLKTTLPWPRTFETAIEFRFEVKVN